MKTFLLVFNTENRSDLALDFTNRFVKRSSIDIQMVLSAHHLSVFLIHTRWTRDQLLANLAEMNDDSIKYWLEEHMLDCILPQIQVAMDWVSRHSDI